MKSISACVYGWRTLSARALAMASSSLCFAAALVVAGCDEEVCATARVAPLQAATATAASTAAATRHVCDGVIAIVLLWENARVEDGDVRPARFKLACRGKLASGGRAPGYYDASPRKIRRFSREIRRTTRAARSCHADCLVI